MTTPSLLQFVIRVGGVLAMFAIAITLTTKYFPGYEGHVVLVLAIIVFCGALIEARIKRVRSRGSNK